MFSIPPIAVCSTFATSRLRDLLFRWKNSNINCIGIVCFMDAFHENATGPSSGVDILSNALLEDFFRLWKKHEFGKRITGLRVLI